MAETKLTFALPTEMASSLAQRLRTLRLMKNWTQETLAERAGVTVHSYRRFETSGQASFELVLKVAHALARLNEFEQLFQPPPAASIESLEQRSAQPTRQRGRR